MRTERRSPLELWHLLSLDAPTVAALWTWFVARCCGIVLPLAALASMFVAVWMLYAGDRLLDARTMDDAQTAQFEERHRFHHQHRRAFLANIVLAALLLAYLLPASHPQALRLYSLLGSLLFAWFLLIHARVAASGRLAKELAVGLFFPAAVFIPTVAREPDLRAGLLLPAMLFAAVCTLNCLYVYRWEHPTDVSEAHWTTRLAAGRLPGLSALTAASSLLSCLMILRLANARAACLPAACAGSALLLWLLHRLRAKLSAVHLRAAADLALLTPLLFAPWLRNGQQ